MDLLDRLVRHDHWATHQLLDRSRNLSDAPLDQPFDIGLQTVRATFEPMIGNVAFWTASMTGQPLDAQRDDRSPAALIERHACAHTIFAALAHQRPDEQRLDETFVDHVGARVTCGATILHVILHNAPHRSEARHLLDRLGWLTCPKAIPRRGSGSMSRGATRELGQLTDEPVRGWEAAGAAPVVATSGAPCPLAGTSPGAREPHGHVFAGMKGPVVPPAERNGRDGKVGLLWNLSGH